MMKKNCVYVMHLNTNSGNFITMAEWNKGFWVKWYGKVCVFVRPAHHLQTKAIKRK